MAEIKGRPDKNERQNYSLILKSSRKEMRKKGRLGSMQTGIGETILDVIFIFGLHSGMILAAFDSAVKLSHCLC